MAVLIVGRQETNARVVRHAVASDASISRQFAALGLLERVVVRVLGVAFAAVVFAGCHRWTPLVRSGGFTPETPIAIDPVRVTRTTVVEDALLEDGLLFAREVANEMDTRLIGMLVHDGANVRNDARVHLEITITRVHPVTSPWSPPRASITAVVRLREGDVVRDAIITHVVHKTYPTLGMTASRDIADWVAYRRHAW